MLSVHQFLYGNGNPFYTKAESDSRYANIDGSNVALAPQFDNSLALANTQWVRRQGIQYGSITQVGSATTLSATHAGRLVAVNGTSAFNITLPTAASVVAGATYTFYVTNSVSATLLPNGSDTLFVSGNSVASIIMKAGDTLEVTAINSTAFMVTGGSLSTKYSAFMADPVFTTPPQFDSTQKLATTAFVQRAMGNYQATPIISASGTLAWADAGKLLLVDTSAGNVTLNLPNDVPAGTTYRIIKAVTQNNTITINSPASTNIIGQGGFNGGIATNVLVLRNYDGAELTSSGPGGNWIANGSIAGSASLSANGYQKFPSGLIIQWGAAGGVTSTGQVVTYPIAFPNALLAVTATPSFTNATVSCYAATYSTGTPKTSVGISVNTGNVAVGWIAVGY